jgi:cytochrome c peroxidase
VPSPKFSEKIPNFPRRARFGREDFGQIGGHAVLDIGGGMYTPFGVVEKPGAELLPPNDKGRFMVTKTLSDEYVFKVPTAEKHRADRTLLPHGQAWDLR